MTKFVVAVSLVALFLCQVQAVTEAPELEQSTESPIADMALIGDSVMAPKTPTEKPPVAPAMAEKSAPVEALEKSAQAVPAVQPHTVADFIIHPLIAFKPRQASLDEIQGKQAQAPATGAPATSGTWLFGMNPAQQLGSSFSTLAGSVSGWFNDRLAAAGQQIPQSFVETPVRESSTSSTTSTTTTQRPDIVVRVQQRPQRNGNRKGNGNGNGNLNNNFNGNGNGNGNRRRQRPNRYNNRLDSLEDEYYDEEDDYFQGNRFDEEFDDEDEDDLSLEQFEDEDSLEAVRPQKKRKQSQVQVQNQRRKFGQQNQEAPISQKRRPATQNKKTQKTTQQKKQPVQVAEDSEDEEELDDDENINNDDDVEDEEEIVDDDSQEQDFAPEPSVFGSSSTSTRRSQNQPNFIQRGQQSIISQIRQFTRGQTPGELGNTFRRSQVGGGNSGKTRGRPQQATLVVNRNGQTVYVAPELANGYPYAYQGKKQRVPVSGSFPQPPLTVPIRRQGRPTQYITIPWSQLGLSPPETQSVVSLAEGIQAQPLILNIPQSAINPVRTGSTTNGQKKKKRPQLTAAAVPLLADASLMDIFQPPQIPPSRTGSTSTAAIKPITAQPVLIAAKPVKAGGSGLLPTRIRPGTIVEKAPAMETVEKMPVMEVAEMKPEQEMLMASTEATPQQAANGEQQEFIIVGEDDEPGLSRHVQPAYGDARYVSYGDFHPYFDLLSQNRRFALRKSGRSLESPEEAQKEEVEKKEVQKEEVEKKEVQNEEVEKKEVQKVEVPKEEVEKKEETLKEEVPKEEVGKKEAPKKEVAQEESKKEELPKEVETPKEDQPQSKLL
ncbi:probable serine/threonine-protein kinase kinX [Drosophila bipectinata]|uniref:probable serine/threonine-protein kinase kinX n=1 Tax=Drosophila bipectinata TaxID=42026 RepID=UPI001C8A53B0|nr:uncharacterized protein LOC108120186 [Drosophila bipectinata]